jgi:UDP-N-acetylglucosamine 2-epimerase
LKKYKLISIVGARPQFIKLAAMHRAILKESSIEHIIIHSGQHYDHSMSGQFFDELGIPAPDYNLEVGSGSQNFQIAHCILGLDKVFEDNKPDMVIVYGDTNTTSAAAIASAKRNVKIAHVEAGLREFDKSIPEEVNKLITDSVTDLFFTPTETGKINLASEGKLENVYVTGDISLDLLCGMSFNDQVFEKYSIQNGDYYFMTCHRAANTDNHENLSQILNAIEKLKKSVVWPIHPRTRKVIETYFPSWAPSHVKIIDTCGFVETQTLIKYAVFVITDSGGIIKEAYFHKVPAVIIDKQTEWIETVDEGWNTIAGPDTDEILNVINTWQRPRIHSNCLGDGKAGERIVKEILKSLSV